MLGKIDKYYQTLKYLKKSQIKYLVKNRMGGRRFAVTAAKAPDCASLSLWMPDLDESLEYRKRFCVEEILEGQVTLLYESGRPAGKNWADSGKSHLWNFNLHYLEFLIPLAAEYRDSGNESCYGRFRDYCRRWIEDNREGIGDGWHPYTISLRLTNLWICMDGFGEILQKDREFLQELKDSMYAQYLHLQKKLELHLLGNHYLENLKAVLLGALYFQEQSVYEEYKKKFWAEIKEQILPDGVHYERSLMYHKIILEDLMRAARAVHMSDPVFYEELSAVVRNMIEAMDALEGGMGQTPLFNDAGDNVARPMNSLLTAAEAEFEFVPAEHKKRAFPDAGYYCLANEHMKILMDAGEIAPSYMPGHGHCDALSFELSWRGRPMFVNAGTGQYQGALRSYFRSTAAHNTVMIDDKEQSQCWGEHRVARRITEVSGSCGDSWVEGSLKTCCGKPQKRRMELHENMVTILDQVKGRAKAYFRLAPEYRFLPQYHRILIKNKSGVTVGEMLALPSDDVTLYTEGDVCSYAPEFGKILKVPALEIAWDGDGTDHEIRIFFWQRDIQI